MVWEYLKEMIYQKKFERIQIYLTGIIRTYNTERNKALYVYIDATLIF
jgi:predicted small secreted protein